MPETNSRGSRAAFRAVAAAAALLLAGSVAACAPADSGLGQDTARQLQQRVLNISQAAAGDDPAAGLSALDGLESDLAAATASGRVSEDRRRSITTAAAAVRADLTAIKASADAAAAKAAEDAAAAQRQAEADAAAADAAKIAPAPAAPAKGESKGSEGKGKGKDNG